MRHARVACFQAYPIGPGAGFFHRSVFAAASGTSAVSGVNGVTFTDLGEPADLTKANAQALIDSLEAQGFEGEAGPLRGRD